jgi:hypothetical protein
LEYCFHAMLKIFFSFKIIGFFRYIGKLLPNLDQISKFKNISFNFVDDEAIFILQYPQSNNQHNFNFGLILGSLIYPSKIKEICQAEWSWLGSSFINDLNSFNIFVMPKLSEILFECLIGYFRRHINVVIKPLLSCSDKGFCNKGYLAERIFRTESSSDVFRKLRITFIIFVQILWILSFSKFCMFFVIDKIYSGSFRFLMFWLFLFICPFSLNFPRFLFGWINSLVSVIIDCK